jgi:hypothetical protein
MSDQRHSRKEEDQNEESGPRDSSGTPQQLPSADGDPGEHPARTGSKKEGQSGRGGSGDAADLQSVEQSQSDRASGTSS